MYPRIVNEYLSMVFQRCRLNLSAYGCFSFMNKIHFTTLPGDGIGPEVMTVALNVLKTLGEMKNFEIISSSHDVGGIGIDNHGTALPESTLSACRKTDAILFGSVGGPKWENLPPKEQPERAALLPLRKEFELFANLRPGNLYPELADLSPLRSDTVANGIDVLCVRELTGGIYFGQPKSTQTLENGEERAIDTMVYQTGEIERITEIAVKAAALRSGRICSVDKANVLETSVLWRKVVTECVAKLDSSIELSHMYVDNAAMQLVRDPNQFDVLVTENMFGDIIRDQAGGILGSLGLMPSACVGDNKSYFEPSHGSAPDLCGQNVANPYSMIGSLALMFHIAMDREDVADRVWSALFRVLERGTVTQDLARHCSSLNVVTTSEFGSAVLKELDKK